jgi:hypothetical protein
MGLQMNGCKPILARPFGGSYVGLNLYDPASMRSRSRSCSPP